MGKLFADLEEERLYQEGVYCDACGDEIYPAEPSFFTGEAHIHEDCAREYISEQFSVDELARALGFVRQ